MHAVQCMLKRGKMSGLVPRDIRKLKRTLNYSQHTFKVKPYLT